MNEEKLGYLIAKVEEMGADQKDFGSRLTSLEQRVDDKFKTAEATLRVLGWVASGAVAAITIPWDKVTTFFKRLVA